MTTSFTAAEKITGKIEFPDVFTSTGILVKITNPTIPEWRKVGYLKIEALIDGDFFNAQFRSIEFGNSLISIPYSAYRLTFEPIDSLLILHPNLSIQIAEFNLNMYIDRGEVKFPEVGDPIYSEVIPPAPNVSGQIFSIAPSRPRRSALITNKTDKLLYLKEGSATSLPTLVADDPFVGIEPGGSYTVEDYNGEIVGLIPGGTTVPNAKILVKELPYLPSVTTTIQSIVPNGTLPIPFGTIALAKNGSANIIWTAKTGGIHLDGGAEEVFVVNNNVYACNVAGECYFHAGDYSGEWVIIPARLYEDLRTTAANIITSGASFLDNSGTSA
jgi:hypothetical protein